MAISATPISLDLDSVTLETLLALATSENTTSDRIVGAAIRQYAATKADLAMARQRYEQFERDGLHVTGDEMGDWFLAVERGEDPPVPECHV